MGSLAVDVEHFRARILQDALTEATAAYWERRARAFDAVHPHEPRLPLNARPVVVAAASTAAQTALACRRQAWLVKQETCPPISDEVWAVLGEVA